MRFHLHPDGIVYVRDENGATLYAAPLADCEAALGKVMPALPDGMVEAVYEPGVYLCYADAKGNAHPVEGEPPAVAFADEVIARHAELGGGDA